MTLTGSAPCTDLDNQVHQTKVGADSAVADSPATLDVALLTRSMVNGDEAAYRTFYDRYFHRLSRYLLVVTRGDEDTTREVLQATLVRVVRHIKTFPDEAAFWNWLAVLARSALGDQGKRRRRYLAFLDRFTQHAQIEHSASHDDKLVWRSLLPPVAPAEATQKNYALIRSQPLPAAAVVLTQPFATDPRVDPLPIVAQIRTPTGGGQFREIDDDELLALAQPKPAALVRLGPHAAQLVVLNPAD